ncbi:MAG TPA: hypothetical protein VKZ89_18525 [Thermobifida alba]|nr:hypothetical protein [Thermobifida alba]
MRNRRSPDPVPDRPGPFHHAFLAVLRFLVWLIAGGADPAWA